MRGAIFLLFALAMLMLKVNAISFVSDFLENNTLELIEGTSKIYSIRLQNIANEEVGVRLDYDTTYMKVIDYKEIYTLAPKETGYRILFNVTAPKKPGVYTVGYTVGEVEPSGGGLPLRLKMSKSFNLKVIEKPKIEPKIEKPNKLNINYEYLAYAVIVLSLLLYLIIRKMHSTKQPRKQKSK